MGRPQRRFAWDVLETDPLMHFEQGDKGHGDTRVPGTSSSGLV